MKNKPKTTPARVLALPLAFSTGLTHAQQDGHMMGGGWYGGWMGSYGGMWLPILLIIIVGLVVWIVINRRK